MGEHLLGIPTASSPRCVRFSDPRSTHLRSAGRQIDDPRYDHDDRAQADRRLQRALPQYAALPYDVEIVRLAEPGEPCNQRRCGTEQFCCNFSCSICAPEGGFCTQQFCL